MKFKALLSLLFIPITLLAQWTKTGGPVEVSATSIEIAGSNLFLGTNGTGLFISTNKGASWARSSSYPDSARQQPISKVIYHAGMVYVATTDHIYVSADNGVSFQYGDTGLPDTLQNYDIYQANNTLYATAQLVNPLSFNTTQQLYYYDDLNTVWNQVYNIPTGYVVTGIAALHDTLYCAVFGHGLYTTYTNGVIWDSLNTSNGRLGSNNIRSLASYGQQLYAMAYDNTPSLYISPDAINWNSYSLSFTGGNTITTMAVYKDTICLGSPGTIYVSTNNSASWRSTTSGYYNVNEAKFTGHGIIAADLGNGFLLSADDSTWKTSNTGLNYSSPYHLAVQYNKLYAMDVYNTFHSSDHGTTWSEDTNRLFNLTAMARMGNKLIGFSKYGQNDLYSLDQGQTWGIEAIQGVNILVNGYVVNNTTRQIYAWGQADVRRSDDYGKTWTSLFYSDPYSIHDTLFTGLVRIKNRLFLTWTDPVSKLFYSDDSGNHWQRMAVNDTVYHVEAVDTTLLISTNAGIKRSTDLGATFNTVYGGDLFKTYVNGNVIFNYTGPYTNSIAYSTDLGSTWTDISPVLDSIGSFNDLTMDDTYLYAATNQHSVWRRSLSSIGISYTPDTSNNYTVNVGVNMLTNNEQPLMNIYPVPFGDQFNINITTTASHYIDIKLYDALGRCVKVISQEHFDAGTHEFVCNVALPAGVYYVSALVDGNMTTKKVVHY